MSLLNFYYTEGYTYKQLTKELKVSPNQLKEIIKRHEEKNDAIANKKKMLSCPPRLTNCSMRVKLM